MKRLLVLICTILVSANMSFAGMGTFDAGTLNREQMRDMRMHEFQTREKSKANLIQREKELTQKTSNIPVSAVIKTINFDGNEAISSQALYEVVDSNIGQVATEQNVVTMRNMLLKYYNANGYYSAIVFPDITQLSSGVMIFRIKEGGKNSITVE
ncbi:hypothetical protein IJD44_06635 [bacterium]|nr:hypothetical protein [bacterium]